MAEMTNMELITQPIKEAYVRIELRAQDGGLLENLEDVPRTQLFMDYRGDPMHW